MTIVASKWFPNRLERSDILRSRLEALPATGAKRYPSTFLHGTAFRCSGHLPIHHELPKLTRPKQFAVGSIQKKVVEFPMLAPRAFLVVALSGGIALHGGYALGGVKPDRERPFHIQAHRGGGTCQFTMNCRS
jgi:hypothetical protein